MCAVAEEMHPRLVHPARREDRALKQTLIEMAEATGAEAFARQQRAIMSRADSRPLLGAIACPVLVLVGDGDQLTPPELAREIAAAIPSAELEIVRECGHLSTFEQPEAVTAALLSAWDR